MDKLAVVKSVCMTVDEKKILPADLIVRDKSGMYYPKSEFIDFIRKVTYTLHSQTSTLHITLLNFVSDYLNLLALVLSFFSFTSKQHCVLSTSFLSSSLDEYLNK